MERTDYYKALGLMPSATAEQIKDAYRTLAFRYHPDRNADDADAADRMKRVNEAYAVLSHPEKRREYDRMRDQFGASAANQFRSRHTNEEIFRGTDIHTVFTEMARSFGFRDYHDIFQEFYGPVYKTFEFKQPGFRARGHFYFSGFGCRRRRCAQPQQIGRLSRFLAEKLAGAALPENGGDIEETIWLTPETARTGGPYAYVSQRTGRKLMVKIPSGVHEGQKIRLAGMGNPGKRGGTAGHLYLRVKLRRPLLQRAKQFVRRLLAP